MSAVSTRKAKEPAVDEAPQKHSEETKNEDEDDWAKCTLPRPALKQVSGVYAESGKTRALDTPMIESMSWLQLFSSQSRSFTSIQPWYVSRIVLRLTFDEPILDCVPILPARPMQVRK